jgi:transposase
MPRRPFNREQTFLLPPTLGELIPDDHPVRFVAEFVDALDSETLIEMGIGPEGEPLGAPAYHPKALLCVWLYGFMTGTRSSRKLEAACRDQVSYLWLTGWQHPDHNTLWRFYQAHRQAMRRLLKYTVATAVELKLIDLAIQAVDGTRISANAARARTYDTAGLQRLLQRTEAAIAQMEAQNEGGDDMPPPRLPEELQRAQVMREQIRDAMSRLEQDNGQARVNLTDEDSQLMKGRDGIINGYNAQAMVSPLSAVVDEEGGMFVTAADVVNTASDAGQLVSMTEQAEKSTGERVPVILADGGYHTAANLAAGEHRGQTLVMGERYQQAVKKPYFKDQFQYDMETDSYVCPHGHRLHFRGLRRSRNADSGQIRVYRASRTTCRSCSAFGICTKDAHAGRALWIGPSDILLRKHRKWMKTDKARALYARRQGLCEPVFGILKDQMGARRFLLRGLENVRSEFALLATAFNLRTLCRIWRRARSMLESPSAWRPSSKYKVIPQSHPIRTQLIR